MEILTFLSRHHPPPIYRKKAIHRVSRNVMWRIRTLVEGTDTGRDSLGKQSRRKRIIQPFIIFYSLPLSQVWGSGILSSSAGHRLPVSGKNRHARAFPPTLGYGQGLTFYSWTSDQLSQYGSKPVIITARDATYVLDAILGNETELAILEHTTDTAGATEIIFALFDLLGLRFTPRLRDIGSRRLYRSGVIDLDHYPRLQPHITGRINRQRVLDW